MRFDTVRLFALWPREMSGILKQFGTIELKDEIIRQTAEIEP